MRDEARPWQTFIPVKIPFVRVGQLSEYTEPVIQKKHNPS